MMNHIIKKYFLIILLIAFTVISFNGCSTSFNTFYVSVEGDNSNSGLGKSPQKAWRTLTYAVSQIQPGDHVLVVNGEYVDDSIVLKNLHASADRPTIIRAINNWESILTRPEEASIDTSVVLVSNCSYLHIEGFEIFDNQSGRESGVDVRDDSHHITVKNNYIHDCACGGISSRMSDYLTYESNVVRDNAKRNEWNCSGISILFAHEHDQEPGYHNIIRKNVVFENECTLPFKPLGFDVPTDGNGIILDLFKNPHNEEWGQPGGYRAKTLIEHNLCFNNGGRGFNVFESAHVTLRNNTSYHNMRVIHKYSPEFAEITLQNANDVEMYNNILVKHPGYNNHAFSILCYDEKSGDNKVYDNIMIGSTEFCGENLLNKDNQQRPANNQNFPEFVNPTVDVEFNSIDDFESYFGLKQSRPAVGKGCY